MTVKRERIVGTWAVGLVMAVMCLPAGAQNNNCNARQVKALTEGRQVKALEAVTIGSGWQTFSWDGAAPVAVNENPFTFTAGSEGAVLKVTDCCVVGDQFEVFDNLVSLGQTSVPADDGSSPAGTADEAYANPKYSHGIFTLGAGAHSITVTVINEATGYTSGGGWLRVDGAPIPTLNWGGRAVLIGLLALAGVFFLVRRLHA